MAVAKEYLFTSDSRLTADFGKAIGHAARVEIISALLENPVLSFEEILLLIPLGRSTINDHLRSLRQYRLLDNDTLPSGNAGYSLNKAEYNKYRHAIKRCFSVEGKLRKLSDGLEEGEVG